ncbi:cysteine hydrolase family protein [Hoeflea olei]|uniref:cysteine hydrolase family protein n=1 Tax=Hoeflea olei TaxID=1480615 RepID=UPI001FDABAE9|nr:isochorismatase family cysteine hydrolase [Hoeflea olei]
MTAPDLIRPALMVIDLANDFLAAWEPARRARLIAATNELVGIFRAAGRPVIWVRQEFRHDLGDAFLEMRDRGVRLTIAGTDGAKLDAQLQVLAHDITIVKKRYSPFFGTDLDQVLAAREIGSLVIAGINTHACVRMAAIDAYQRDMRVILSAEATGSYDEDHARVSLRYMDGKIARVLDTDAIRAAIA